MVQGVDVKKLFSSSLTILTSKLECLSCPCHVIIKTVLKLLSSVEHSSLYVCCGKKF
jgi:hypothetical protein